MVENDGKNGYLSGEYIYTLYNVPSLYHNITAQIEQPPFFCLLISLPCISHHSLSHSCPSISQQRNLITHALAHSHSLR